MYKRQEPSTRREHLGARPVFGGIFVDHRLSFSAVVFCFVCICVPNIAIVCWLSRDCPFDFLQRWLCIRSAGFTIVLRCA